MYLPLHRTHILITMSFLDTIAELEAKLFKLHPDAKKVYSVINDLKDLIPVEKITNKPERVVVKLVFDKNWPATEQVEFALKYANKISKITEIEKIIKEFDDKFNKGLNTPIDKLKRLGTVITYNPNNSNHSVFYGLKDWFEDDGTLKDDYLF